MSISWGFVQLVALVWLGFAALLALGSVVLLPRFVLPALSKLSPGKRSLILWALAGLPLWGGGLLCGLCFLPSVLALVWPALDHCLHHGGHLHLCIAHGLAVPVAFGGLLPLGAVLALMLARVGAVAIRQVRAHRRIRALRDSACHDAEVGVFLLEVQAPWAFVAGLVEQRIFLSRRLREGLSDRSLALLMAHERAHVARRDNLRRWTASVLSVLHFSSMRQLLLDRLELSCEQASDAQAAPNELDRLQLAQLLLRLGRLAEKGSTPMPWATVGAAGHIEPRVEALLAPVEPQQPASWRVAVWAAVIPVTAAMLTEPLHHTTESLLGLILG